MDEKDLLPVRLVGLTGRLLELEASWTWTGRELRAAAASKEGVGSSEAGRALVLSFGERRRDSRVASREGRLGFFFWFCWSCELEMVRGNFEGSLEVLMCFNFSFSLSYLRMHSESFLWASDVRLVLASMLKDQGLQLESDGAVCGSFTYMKTCALRASTTTFG